MDRRALLGALAATPFAGGSASAASTPAFDPSNPLHTGLAYRKLGWSANDQLTFHWLHLIRYGMVDSKLTPMWNILAGSFFRAKDLGEGRYEVTSLSVDFFTDIESGKLLETYNNPWTGKTLKVPYKAPKPTTRQHEPTGLKLDGMRVPGMKVETKVNTKRAWVENGEVFINGDLDIRMMPDSSAGAAMAANKSVGARSEGMGGSSSLVQVNDWFTYSGKASDVMNPAVKNPPSQMTFNDLNTWSAWLEMDGHPGNFIGRGFGRKVFKYADMPASWRQLTEAKYPAIAKDPDGALKG